MEVNKSKILMSEELASIVGDDLLDMDDKDLMFVDVIMFNVVDDVKTQETISGLLKSFSLSSKPTLSFKTETIEAFKTMSGDFNNIDCFIISYNNETLKISGPLKVEERKIEDIDEKNQVCVLSIKMSL